MNRRDYERFAYLTAFAGTIGDHLSSRIGLLYSGIRELNSFTVSLRGCNLWLAFDALLLILSLGVPALIMRRWSFRGRWAVLAFPILVGAARLVATMHNVLTVLSIT
ncbi:MAG: hypothetical protein JSV18_05750 [Candidatus Bathyarchaeota archaeon]|nr:MAG: hypothetical protein JSV18_05750 [Candidatus Bathyarchaeota archaeon]